MSERPSLAALAPDCVDPAPQTRDRLDAYVGALVAANQRLNLMARSTTAEQVWGRHVRHCLVLARRRFPPGSVVVDWGTGGGLPGAVLAAWFPDVEFVLVDSIAKKCRALEEVLAAAKLDNARVWHGRAETFTEPFDYAVSRATAPLAALWSWSQSCLRAGSPTPRSTSLRAATAPEGEWARGLIALKGGELADELAQLPPGLVVEVGPDLGAETDRPHQNGWNDWSVDLAAKRVVHVASRV